MKGIDELSDKEAYRNLTEEEIDSALLDVTKGFGKEEYKLYIFDTLLTEDYKNKVSKTINKGNNYP